MGLELPLSTKVKGHADEGLMAKGRVREVDHIGNNEAGAAADLGRKRVHHSISDARRLVHRACEHWYPVARELHRYFIAIARAALSWYYSSSFCLVGCC